MSFWAVLFLEFWKRKQFVTQHYWDTLDFEAAEVHKVNAAVKEGPEMY